MTTERLEIRLAAGQRQKLDELARDRDLSAAAVLRDLLDAEYEEFRHAARAAAVQTINSMEIEDMPDPDELSRQLAETYDSPLP